MRVLWTKMTPASTLKNSRWPNLICVLILNKIHITCMHLSESKREAEISDKSNINTQNGKTYGQQDLLKLVRSIGCTGCHSSRDKLSSMALMRESGVGLHLCFPKGIPKRWKEAGSVDISFLSWAKSLDVTARIVLSNKIKKDRNYVRSFSLHLLFTRPPLKSNP